MRNRSPSHAIKPVALTKREEEIWNLRGLPPFEIAARTGVKKHTVNRYLQSARDKIRQMEWVKEVRA